MTLRAGTRLGGYEVLAPLGAGGMGEVYRARDSKLERDVAIKVLPARLTSDPDALARFEREAKAVAALSHPNILAIHDFGTDGGVSYAVMELLEGETLRGKLAAGTIPQKQAIDYALQTAKGLSAAHGKGLVHRDLKPENVFVSKDGHVKILDFGLAKRIDAFAEQTSAPTGSGGTEPGTVMGTMGYMSPEQVRGLPVDHRSDIFSLGAILYELLSGQKAFKRDTASDTMAAIMRDDPPELTQSGRNISPALDHIVRHCLEKDRENRFQTAKDIAFALSEASAQATVDTTGVHALTNVGKPGRRMLAIAAVVVVLVAAAVFLWRRPAPESKPSGGVKRIAVLPFENLGAPEDDYFADGISDEVRSKLTSLPGVEVIARASSTGYKKTAKKPREIADELGVSYLLTATVRWQKSGGAAQVHVTPELVELKASGAPASKWQQPFDASLTNVFQVQSEIASKVAEALGVALAEGQKRQLSEKPTQNLAAYDAFLRGEEVSGAMTRTDPQTIRRALDHYDRAVALDPGFALAWARIGVANSFRYYSSTPTPEVEQRARDAAQKAVTLAPDRPEPYFAMGYYYRLVRSDPQRALEELTKGQRIAPGNPDLIRAISLVDEMLGRFDEALERSREAERLDPRGVSNIRVLADNLMSLRRWSEARQAVDRGLAISPDNLVLIELKTITFLGEGDLPAARAFLREVHGRVDPTELVAYVANFQDLVWVLDGEQTALLRRLTPAAFDDDEGTWAICQAQACAFAGDAACAREYAERARKAFETRIASSPNESVSFVTGRLIALGYLGRKEETVREAGRLAAAWPLTRNGRDDPYARHQVARAYILAGEQEKALDVLEPLLQFPYALSPGWLKIDPNFDPLRKNPRFQKLVAAK